MFKTVVDVVKSHAFLKINTKIRKIFNLFMSEFAN